MYACHRQASFFQIRRAEHHPRPTLRCRVQHVFDKDPISGGGIVNKDMGHCAHQLPILNNW